MAEDFPSVLSRLRREKHINQRTAATALNISQALLSHYENGLREPGLDFINTACEYYGVSADYLLGRSSVKVPFAVGGDEADTFMSGFSEITAAAIAEVYKGLECCGSSETGETVSNMIYVFLYNLLRSYDKSGAFEIPLSVSAALCDAAIKLGQVRLSCTANENELSFTTPPSLKEAAETELALILNEWK